MVQALHLRESLARRSPPCQTQTYPPLRHLLPCLDHQQLAHLLHQQLLLTEAALIRRSDLLHLFVHLPCLTRRVGQSFADRLDQAQPVHHLALARWDRPLAHQLLLDRPALVLKSLLPPAALPDEPLILYLLRGLGSLVPRSACPHL